jgi:hypothetical protein
MDSLEWGESLTYFRKGCWAGSLPDAALRSGIFLKEIADKRTMIANL